MQPPAVAFLRTERISEPLTEAEQEEEREMSMYVDMFPRADPEQRKVSTMKDVPTQTARPASADQTTQAEPRQDSGSERTESEDAEDEVETQQRTLHAVWNASKSSLTYLN